MAPFKCCGCGAEAVGLTKPCDCPTMVGWRNTGDRKTEYCTWDSPPDPRDATIATLRALLDRAEKALDKFFSPAMLANLIAADQLNSDLVGFGDNNKIDRDDIELPPDMTWGDLRLARSTLEDIRKGEG